jgi:hypothetical protein
MPARGRGSQSRYEERTAERKAKGKPASRAGFGSLERRLRPTITYFAEPVMLGGLRVVGVSSDAAPSVLHEWMPVQQRMAA